MRSLSLSVTITATALVALAAGYLHARPAAAPADARAFDLPAMQVVDLGGRVLRLDTRTGAMDLLKGDATFGGNTAYWTKSVPPVSETNSGVLTLQSTATGGKAAFLVDALEGTTWILRWRGNQNGQWSKMELK